MFASKGGADYSLPEDIREGSSRIPFCSGVCGTAWKRKESIVVPDMRGGNVIALIDIDSRNLNAFDEADREGLEKITGLIHID